LDELVRFEITNGHPVIGETVASWCSLHASDVFRPRNATVNHDYVTEYRNAGHDKQLYWFCLAQMGSFVPAEGCEWVL
jgi:hypothetical protein